MGLSELASRIHQSGARAAVIISMWHGNPGDLSLIDPDGSELAVIRVESALLRREIVASPRTRVTSVSPIAVKSDSPDRVQELALILSDLLECEVEEHTAPPRDGPRGECTPWLEPAPSGRVIWTHYHAYDGTEIGPRIRVKEVRKSNIE